MIGIVAGVGPFAGLDLAQKILDETLALKDQDHVSVLSWSQPEAIPDRTQFLLGETAVNPADPMLEQLLSLERAGATVAGIPCNTAHAPAIFDKIREGLAAAGSNLQLLHMIAEVGAFLRATQPHMERVGILSTTGTAVTRIYPLTLEPLGFTVLSPPQDVQTNQIHPAIYNPHYGIKALGADAPRARKALLDAAATLRMGGAQAIILGCTEMPLVIQENSLMGMTVIDPTRVLARALIRQAAPDKLKPLSQVDNSHPFSSGANFFQSNPR